MLFVLIACYKMVILAKHANNIEEEFLKKKQAEIEAMRAQATEGGRQAVEFSVRRQAEEQRLANAISPFLEGKPNPVTVGNTPDEPEKSQ